MPHPFLISSIRGTVFVPRIPYNRGLVNELLNKFDSFVPVTYGSPLVDNGIFFNPGDWEIKSQDGLVRIIFQSQKIDYIEVSQKDYSVETINEFAKRCYNVFCDLAPHFGQVSTRLALAPSFTSNNAVFNGKEFLSSIFVENRLSFEGADLDNCDFSQVFRPLLPILDAEVSINFLSKFSKETVITLKDNVNTPIQLVRADFDINTTPVAGVSFPIEAIKDFFDKSPSFCDKFYQFYFHD